MEEFVARIGDTAVGHTDIQGNPAIGTVQSGSSNTSNGGVGVANSESVVFFPSHPHATDEGVPIDYQTHSVPISATGKNYVNGNRVAINNDVVPVADYAGGDANIVATSANLMCKRI